MTRISEKERLEAAAERYEVLKHVLRDPLHTRNLGREDTLRELIDWVNDEIEARAKCCESLSTGSARNVITCCNGAGRMGRALSTTPYGQLTLGRTKRTSSHM